MVVWKFGFSTVHKTIKQTQRDNRSLFHIHVTSVLQVFAAFMFSNIYLNVQITHQTKKYKAKYTLYKNIGNYKNILTLYKLTGQQSDIYSHSFSLQFLLNAQYWTRVKLRDFSSLFVSASSFCSLEQHSNENKVMDLVFRKHAD